MLINTGFIDYDMYTQRNNLVFIDIYDIAIYNNPANTTKVGYVYMVSLQRKTVKGIEYWSLVESKRINGKPTPVVIEYLGNTKNLPSACSTGGMNAKSSNHTPMAILML